MDPIPCTGASNKTSVVCNRPVGRPMSSEAHHQDMSTPFEEHSIQASAQNMFGMIPGSRLPCLRHLNLEGCTYLKELPESIGQLSKLERLNVHDGAKLKRLAKPITRLTTLGRLDVSRCSTLKLLPQQLGDMKGLQFLDASNTAIEILPDSIGHLKKLIHLDLSYCKKLRKLPEQFGNMEGLETFYATGSAIEQLKRLPDQLGKMQCLEAIEELPYSIGLLPRIQALNFYQCKKLTYVPDSILNLKSLYALYLTSEAIIKIDFIDAGNDLKLTDLHLSCNIRESLPMILSLTSLTSLHLRDEWGSLSPTKPFSFSKLFNLQTLSLTNCTSHGSCFPELPLNLRELYLNNYASLEQVPDLSNLKQLKAMSITSCCRLHALEKLPPHLSDLTIRKCTSLQDLPDLSTLRDLVRLEVIHNGSTLEVSLNESHLQVRHSWWSSFRASLQNREIAEWFNYKNRGCTVCFDVPPNLGDNFVGVAFWVVYNSLSVGNSAIEVFITNKTEDMTTRNITIDTTNRRLGEVLSSVKCIKSEGDISIKSGDKLMVSFQLGRRRHDRRHSTEELKNAVKMCGAHLIPETPSTTSIPF